MNPFTEEPARSAGAWGESRLIDAIRAWLGEASPPPPEGIGDDCALFTPTPGARILVTTDPILWERHFDREVTPEQAARKLLRRNLSDIAAMGGRPRIAVVSLLLPASTSLEWIERFYLGLKEVSLHDGVPIAGGDVSQTDGLLGASMTIIGETASGRALARAGAAAGDRLFVTGSLGGSRLGRHFTFEPRLSEGQWLGARPEVVAGMDISDGLAKDLLAVIPSGCGADLFPKDIPISDDAKKAASASGRPSLHHALCDGEDHELLVAVRGDPTQMLKSWKSHFDIPLTCIGILSAREPDSQEPLLSGLPVEVTGEMHGYEHLR